MLEWNGSGFVSVLIFLLPGFITAWIFHGLTPFPKPSQFERIVQALILTMFVQAAVVVIRIGAMFLGTIGTLGSWSDDVTLVWSVAVAVVFGLLLARWANHDTIHSMLRAWNFTSLTSFPSEWFSEFSRNETYVVLHLEGGRRLYGWPEQWPDEPNAGQFSIAEAEWLSDENERQPLSGVQNILIPVSEVEFVEFMDLDACREPVEEEEDADQGAEASA